MKTRRLVNCAALTALALTVHIVESMLPPLLPFAPGVRMGLANIFSFLALIFCGWQDALAVLVIRCVLGAAITGAMSSLLYSLTAGLLSYAVMLLLYGLCYRAFSLTGISLCCAMVHNTAQVLVASLVLSSPAVLYYIPYVVLVGSVAGLFTGCVTYFVVRYGGKQIAKAMK